MNITLNNNLFFLRQKKSMYNEAEVIAINSIVKLLKSDRVASDEFLLYIKVS